MTALEAFRDAIEAENQAEAVELAPSVLDELDARSERERGIELAARSVATDGSSSKAALSAANEVTESILAAESVRTSLAYSVIALAQGRFDREATLDTIDEIISANDEVETAVDSFRATDTVANLNPILVAFTTGGDLKIPKGSTDTTAVSVENSGGRPAEPVEVDSEAPSELDVSPAQIERIAGGKTATVEVMFPATLSAGRYSARLTVDAPAASPSSAVVSAVVLSKADYADRAISSLSDLQERLSEVVAELNRPSRPFDNRVRKVQGDLQSAIDAIDSESQGDGKSGNSGGKSKGESKGKSKSKGEKKEITTGQSPNKHLELAVKHLNGLSGLIGSLQGIESGVRASLQSELDAIEDTIEDAITADA